MVRRMGGRVQDGGELGAPRARRTQTLGQDGLARLDQRHGHFGHCTTGHQVTRHGDTSADALRIQRQGQRPVGAKNVRRQPLAH